MARPARLNIPLMPQHVVQRGNNRQACFLAENDFRLYLQLLAKSCVEHQCRVHAYVLMTNHVHLLLTPEIPNGVSLLFRDLGRDYVRKFNRKYGRTGTLWEGRFRSSLVDRDEYCLACYRYIEMNPVRAGMVDQPGLYRWSSYAANAEEWPDPLVEPHASWLQLGRSDGERKRAYSLLFRSELPSSQLEVIRCGISKGRPTGSIEFQEKFDSGAK